MNLPTTKKLAGASLLTWFHFNLSMDNNYNQYKVWDEITHPYPNLNGATI